MPDPAPANGYTGRKGFAVAVDYPPCWLRPALRASALDRVLSYLRWPELRQAEQRSSTSFSL